MIRLGIISDTHGLLRPEALAFLQGCAHIVHGGDIGNADILEKLAAIAPLTAVRGNNDTGPWAAALPETAELVVEGIRLLVIHDRQQLEQDPAAAGLRVVVSGHSHKQALEERAGVLWLNPGSCGPRRFRLPVSAAELVVDGSEVQARLVELLPLPPR
jgi:putative phosphoesterase